MGLQTRSVLLLLPSLVRLGVLLILSAQHHIVTEFGPRTDAQQLQGQLLAITAGPCRVRMRPELGAAGQMANRRYGGRNSEGAAKAKVGPDGAGEVGERRGEV